MSAEPFHRCTHTALSPRGEIYVSDGYGNARVHKYSPDGKLLMSWGEPGTGEGEFNIVHNICCDADGWLYVADRENKDQPSGSFAHSATTRYLNWPDPTIIEHPLRVHPFEIRASRRRWQTASSYVLRPTLLGQWLLPMLSGRIETNGGVTMPYGGNDWLALTQEPTFESEIPICDPHHHFWDFRSERIPYQRYLLHELVVDVNCGHNVRSTVFIEARSMYRPNGPVELRPGGEVEFVQGLAAAAAP